MTLFICRSFFYFCFFLSFFYSGVVFASGRVLFSARNVEEGKSGELFVVKNNEVFVRTIKNNVFDYSVPENGTYELDCGAIISVEDGKVVNIGGRYYTMSNDDMITKSRYKDEFYSEPTLECDLQKFDIINKIIVKDEEIEGFQTQLYLPDYYEVLKLILYRSDTDAEGKTKAFVFSEKNDVGCAYYREYNIYKPPVEKEDGKKKKKAKKKKIIAKTKEEFIQKVSTESYKKMMLEDYAYLQPFENGDINKIVLHIEGTDVQYINAMAIDFEWKKLTFDDLLEKKVVKEYNDGDGKKEKKVANTKNKKANKKANKK